MVFPSRENWRERLSITTKSFPAPFILVKRSSMEEGRFSGRRAAAQSGLPQIDAWSVQSHLEYWSADFGFGIVHIRVWGTADMVGAKTREVRAKAPVFWRIALD